MKICIKILPFIVLFFIACKPTRTFISDEKVSKYRLNIADTLKADPSVEAMIQPYRSQLEGQMNEVIGTTAKELTYGNGVSLLGNWACDIILKQANTYYGKKVDITAINQGGLRIRSLPKGAITRGKIYELMPFDNALLILTTDSLGMDKFFQFMASKGGWPIAGATYHIHGGRADHIMIGNEPLSNKRPYTICLSDYIANGGDNADMFKNMKREDINKLLRDAFIEGVIDETKNGRLLDANLDNRIGQ